MSNALVTIIDLDNPDDTMVFLRRLKYLHDTLPFLRGASQEKKSLHNTKLYSLELTQL